MFGFFDGFDAFGEDGGVGEEDGEAIFDGVAEAADFGDEEVAARARFTAEFAVGDGTYNYLEQCLIHMNLQTGGDVFT